MLPKSKEAKVPINPDRFLLHPEGVKGVCCGLAVRPSTPLFIEPDQNDSPQQILIPSDASLLGIKREVLMPDIAAENHYLALPDDRFTLEDRIKQGFQRMEEGLTEINASITKFQECLDERCPKACQIKARETVKNVRRSMRMISGVKALDLFAAEPASKHNHGTSIITNSVPTRSPVSVGGLGLSAATTPSDGESKRPFISKSLPQEEIESFRIILETALKLESAKRPSVLAASCASWIKSGDAETRIDAFCGALIFLNAIYIGASMDWEDGGVGWLLADAFFSMVFLCELLLKFKIHGVIPYLKRIPKYPMNGLDLGVVTLDVGQFLIALVMRAQSNESENGVGISMVRMLRLAKTMRLLKLLKSHIFKDLLQMIQGMVSGMPTLSWACFLLASCEYFIALVFREMFGREDRTSVREYFSSVPRAMVTTFRCSFGDCNNIQGMPILEYIYKGYGLFSVVVFCLFLFIVTTGLFNVICAIFVQSTLLTAKRLEILASRARLSNEDVWNQNIAIILLEMLKIMDLAFDDEQLTLENCSVYAKALALLEIPKERMEALAKTTVATAAMSHLDICSQDIDHLACMLDPDGGGTIKVGEFVDGLRCLRGDFRRSDIIAVNLLIRDVQSTVVELFDSLQKKTTTQKNSEISNHTS